MKYFFALIGLLILNACSTKKITEVSIKNENEYSIAVTVKAVNVSQTFAHIKPHTEFKGMFDWTQVEKKEGQWIFLIKNEQSNGVDSFSHGYFENGELAGYADLISKGSELKVKIYE
jgi:hypothetical protein